MNVFFGNTRGTEKAPAVDFLKLNTPTGTQTLFLSQKRYVTTNEFFFYRSSPRVATSLIGSVTFRPFLFCCKSVGEITSIIREGHERKAKQTTKILKLSDLPLFSFRS